MGPDLGWVGAVRGSMLPPPAWDQVLVALPPLPGWDRALAQPLHARIGSCTTVLIRSSRAMDCGAPRRVCGETHEPNYIASEVSYGLQTPEIPHAIRQLQER